MKPLFNKEEIEKLKWNELLPFECYNCKNTFYTNKKTYIFESNHPERGRVKFCSQSCNNELNNKNLQQKFKCKTCDKEFLKRKVEIKKTKSGNHFCSRSCAAKYNNAHKTIGTKRSKLEIWLESKLKHLYSEQRILFNDVTTINSELDIYFPNLNLAFELNGIFHYEPIYGQQKLDQTQNNDNRKFQACLEKGIELCIIDSSGQKYFKESTSQKYLDIINNIINEKVNISHQK